MQIQYGALSKRKEKAGQAPAFFRKKIQKIFKKTIDKSNTWCYNINVIKRGKTPEDKTECSIVLPKRLIRYQGDE